MKWGMAIGGQAGFLLALAAGCAKDTGSSITDHRPVREAFAALQVALQARDIAKVWDLLDAESKEDADRVAQVVRASYAKATPEEKAAQEKALGLASAELAGLTGQSYLKSSRFHGKYHEIPDSKVEKVVIQADKATVSYIEPDNDHEKLIFLRQDGRWKVSLPMPK